MNIAVHLADRSISRTVSRLLLKMSNVRMVTNGTSSATPDVLLVDVVTLGRELAVRYPAAKVLFIDTGIPREKLCAVLLTYRIHGVLSLDLSSHVLKRALNTVSKGEFWNYNGSVEASLQSPVTIMGEKKVNGITDRQQEMIQLVCQGLSNKEIARRFALSENTVKSHLNRIFKKFHIRSRSRLIALAMQSQEATKQNAS